MSLQLKGGRMVEGVGRFENEIDEGVEYDLRVDAKGASGEGIGKIGDFVVFVKQGKTRIGNVYKIKVTKKYRTFCNAELASLGSGGREVVGDTTELL